VYPHGRGFRFRVGGDGMALMPPMPPMPAMAPMPPMLPMRDFQYDFNDEYLPMMRERMRDAERGMRQSQRAMQDAAREAAREAMHSVRTVQMEPARFDAERLARAYAVPARSAMLMSGWGGGGSGFSLGGLRLTPVGDDLASYFGPGAEHGLLVLDARAPWDDLRAGDVILTVNGKSVRHGDETSISLDSSKDNRFEVLRKGKKEVVTVKGR
jgi:hypothetical protein